MLGVMRIQKGNRYLWRMKNKGKAGVALGVYCGIIFLLSWVCIWALPIRADTAGMLASTSVITGLGIFIIQWLGKREVVGFYFLGSVVFKMFALGFLAIYRKDFAAHLLWYFLFYWLLLAAEVGYAVYAVKKEGRDAL